MKVLAAWAVALAVSVSALSQTSIPPAPTLTAGAGFKGLRFDWNSVPRATWYQFEYRAHQTGPFVQEGDDFPATATYDALQLPAASLRLDLRALPPRGVQQRRLLAFR